MSVQNPERLATKQDLKDMYDRIRPYMGGLITSKAGFTPVGTVISVMGTTAPVNYLACDGTVYNIADYTELANYFNEQFGSKNFFGGDGTTTFAVPDLRGEFLRGTGTNSHTGQGSGANVGVHQDSTEYPEYSFNTGAGSINIQYVRTGGEAYSGTHNADAWGTPRTAVANIPNNQVVSSSNETPTYCTLRPTNTSVLFCIATKNFYIDPTLDYSTDEKIIGTWIDGKPIWQKTLEATSITQQGETDIDISSLNVDQIVKLDGLWQRADTNVWYNFIGIDNHVKGVCLACSIASQTIYIYDNDDYAITKAYVTIQYTKSNS